MIEYFAVGGLCLMLGFGLGRLRLHSVIRHLRKSRKPRGGRPHTVLLDRDTAIEIWKQTFSESSQAARDLFKWLSTACIAGLTASAAILAVKSNSSELQTAAVLFAIALVATSLPTSFMSTRLHEKAQRLGARIARTPTDRRVPVSLPFAWRPGSQLRSELFAIFLFGAAVFALLRGLDRTL